MQYQKSKPLKLNIFYYNIVIVPISVLNLQSILLQAYYHEVCQYLSKAFVSPFHPLSNLLSTLCDCFAATYGGVRVHPRLLKHAVDELNVMVDGLYHIVHALFPALPPAGKEVSHSFEMLLCSIDFTKEITLAFIQQSTRKVSTYTVKEITSLDCM